MLEVSGLNAYYGAAHVLQDVSLTMGAEPVALIGRNGMGKSTLCKALAGVLGPGNRVTGSVKIDGEDVSGKPAHKLARAGIGFVPQGRRLFQSLTVDEHLQIVGASSKAAWTPSRVYELFPRLAERKHVSGTSLSGGEQEMLSIGRALLADPKLLLMDEPTASLDPVRRAELGGLLRDLQGQGRTLIVATHDEEFAREFATRIVRLEGGQVISG